MNTLIGIMTNGVVTIRSQKEPIKITNKLIKLDSQYLKKDDFLFYGLTDEKLTKTQHDKIFKFLDQVFFSDFTMLENGDILEYNKKENEFIVNWEEIINGNDFIEIFQSEIGLKTA